MAVSGSNVAFVLLLAAPLLRYFDYRGRFIGGLAVLFLFGAMTRWEPSVVRAEAMAAMVLTAVVLGRAFSLWRALGLGVSLAVLLDPFLVGSIGFLLSVSAVAGMALLAKPVAGLLPGHQWFRTALAYAIAAQVGVAPVQLLVFGPMPLIGIPANIAAQPLAAALMMWGLAAGLLAGIAGEPVATLLHVPTQFLTSALAWVARTAQGLSLGNWNTGLAVTAGFAVALLAMGKYLWDRHRLLAADDYRQVT